MIDVAVAELILDYEKEGRLDDYDVKELRRSVRIVLEAVRGVIGKK